MNMLFLESELKMPLGMVVLPLRCTVIKTSKGLIMVSPIRFSKHQLKEIHEMGQVIAIAEPSLIHHLYLEEAIEHFPEAKVWGPPGCRKKSPNVHWDKIFGKDKWPYGKEVDAQLIKGIPRLNEVAFFDKASGALIVGDICFNLLNPKGWAAPVMLRLLGTYKQFAVSRMINLFLKDEVTFKASMEKVFAWDFDKIAMSHGDIVTAEGKELLVQAFKKRGHLFTVPLLKETIERIRMVYAA